MSRRTLPAIHNALQRAKEAATTTVLVIEGTDWSPRGIILDYLPDTSDAVRISTEGLGEKVVYTFSATRIIGVGSVKVNTKEEAK